MTNLEYFLADPDNVDKNNYIEIYMKPGYDFEFRNSEETNLVKWLVSEHKQVYKLTQFEYDLLRACDERTPLSDTSFCLHDILMKMKKYGYYKQIENTDYFIRCILELSEVISE